MKTQAKTQLSSMRMFVINYRGTVGIITIRLASGFKECVLSAALKTSIAVGSAVFAALAFNSLPVRPSGLLDSSPQCLSRRRRASEKAAWSPPSTKLHWRLRKSYA